MATLNTFIRPSNFELPEKYTLFEQENDVKSFIKRINSELEDYKKYFVGRHFLKKIKIGLCTILKSNLVQHSVLHGN